MSWTDGPQRARARSRDRPVDTFPGQKFVQGPLSTSWPPRQARRPRKSRLLAADNATGIFTKVVAGGFSGLKIATLARRGAQAVELRVRGFVG